MFPASWQFDAPASTCTLRVVRHVAARLVAARIASTEGLGYRIFLVRRYLAMDVILPYVLWIILLGFLLDWLLRLLVATRYRWYLASQE